MELPKPEWFPPAIRSLLAREPLDPGITTAAFRDLLSGRVEDAYASVFLTALRLRGETPAEIATAARTLREQMIRLVPVSGPVVDTCGTGGDDLGTFNISTAAAFVVAGAGLPVVKHGNRAVSSRSGSADVLRALGVPIDSGVEWAQRCLDRIGFAFCFAPHFHPGMAHVAELRRKLGIRTIFNLLGPLANPAGADYQLLGIGSLELFETLTGAVAALSPRRTILVCGHDGLDEVSLAGPTRVNIVEGEQYRSDEWTRKDFGLDAVNTQDIRADGPEESAAIIRKVLDGEPGPALRIVLANAAAAMFAANAAKNLREGVERAEASIRSGKAKGVLERMVL